MALADILIEAKKLVTPSKEEQVKLNLVIKDITNKITSELKKQKIFAKLFVGGSVAKGTWLPGISDIDFFLIFNYAKYADSDISALAEKVLKSVFAKIQKLHGSRDYFSTKYAGFTIEFVPVLDISRGEPARNITDFSPLHVKWVLTHAKNKDEIRIAKQFMKAAGVYGAESYISGFSGHIADLLVAYYGTFEKLLRAAANWKAKVYLDQKKRYKNLQDALLKLNPSKTSGPLILIDPVEPDRNAAAALGYEKFNTFVKTAKKFLANPSIEFFKEKQITLENLIKTKKSYHLVYFETNTPKGKTDVIGAQMKNIFSNLAKNFAQEDFIIKKSGWAFNSKTIFWFYLDSKALPKTKLHFGPPINIPKEHIKKFRKIWKGRRIFIKNKRYVVELPRKFTKPELLAEKLAKEFKLKLVYNG